jgi:hypothetical protein
LTFSGAALVPEPPAEPLANAAADAVAVAALADGAALDAADDVLGPQADNASPTPRPSAEMPATLVVRVRCPNFIAVPLIAQMDQT